MGKKVFIIGGDERNKILCELLKADGHEAVFLNSEDKADFSRAEIVVGPVIIGGEKRAFLNISENRLLVAGKIKSPLKEELISKGVKLFELLDDEKFIALNAIPTGEGIVQIAMENSDITINNSQVLVLGFGKVGKYASFLFKNLGASVVVATRNLHSEIAQGLRYDYKRVLLKDLSEVVGTADFIINSIPFVYLDGKTLRKIKKESLIIDAASAPYGVDFTFAEKNNIKAILAPGLPGRVAPRTAAFYMKYCMAEYL
jgi:dipicolinate synthase subunit A